MPETTAISPRVPVPRRRASIAPRGDPASPHICRNVDAALPTPLCRAALCRSIHAKLFLQARGGRRVLEHQALVRIDVTVRLLGHQRSLMEAAQDELQLAGISIDVAGRKI